MATFTWNNASGDVWTNGADWTGSNGTIFPGALDVAVNNAIAGAGAYTITATDVNFGKVVLNDTHATLALTPGSTSAVNQNGSTVAVNEYSLNKLSGTLTVQAGTLALGAAPIAEAVSQTFTVASQGGLLLNQGNVVLDEAALGTGNADTIAFLSSITNATTGANFSVLGALTLELPDSATTFVNNGNLTVSGDGSGYGGLNAGSINNTKNLTINNGTSLDGLLLSTVPGSTDRFLSLTNSGTITLGTVGAQDYNGIIDLTTLINTGTINIQGAGLVQMSTVTTNGGTTTYMLKNSGTIKLSNGSTLDIGSIGTVSASPIGVIYFGDGNHNEIDIESTGTLEYGLNVITAGTTVFHDGFTSHIANFQVGDTINFNGHVSGTTIPTISMNGSILQVNDGKNIFAKIKLDGLPTTLTNAQLASHFTLSAGYYALPGNQQNIVSNGSTVVGTFQGGPIYVTTDLCFLTGTRIATPDGETRVEDLQVGQHVLTAAGKSEPIVWIGKGTILATRGRRTAATPVVVRRGALGNNIPHHDLNVTKAHGLYIDDVLIPAEFLINHRSIVWDDRAQEVTLYHVELEQHDILIANGAPAESYRDDGNRWLFHNANTGWDHPPKPACAPVLTGGPVVDAVWRRLLDMAGPRPVQPLTDEPNLWVQASGRHIRPVSAIEGVYIFPLLATDKGVRILSRAASPQQLGLARDPRELGVALRSIAVRQGTRFRLLPANDARLNQGFHDYERGNDFRWTNGDALVPMQLFSGFKGPVELVLTVAQHGVYWDEGTRVQIAS